MHTLWSAGQSEEVLALVNVVPLRWKLGSPTIGSTLPGIVKVSNSDMSRRVAAPKRTLSR